HLLKDFFFSSRRRHTRFSRDWSSDVCSSDLGCHSSGSADIIDKFHEELRKHKLENEIKVVGTGCFGLCEVGPIVIVYPEGAFYKIGRASCRERVKIYVLEGS